MPVHFSNYYRLEARECGQWSVRVRQPSGLPMKPADYAAGEGEDFILVRRRPGYRRFRVDAQGSGQFVANLWELTGKWHSMVCDSPAPFRGDIGLTLDFGRPLVLGIQAPDHWSIEIS